MREFTSKNPLLPVFWLLGVVVIGLVVNYLLKWIVGLSK